MTRLLIRSGSLVKNDQNQQTRLKIKTSAIFDWITFFIWNLQQSLMAKSKSKNSYLCHVTKIIMSSASFRYNTTKTKKYVKELPLIFPQWKTKSKNSFYIWFDFYCSFCLDWLWKIYAFFLGKIAISQPVLKIVSWNSGHKLSSIPWFRIWTHMSNIHVKSLWRHYDKYPKTQ